MNKGFVLVALLLSGCAGIETEEGQPTSEVTQGPGVQWQTVFEDEFNTFDASNWQDQLLWVNNEHQCYVRDGAHNTRWVSDGTLKLAVVDLGEPIACDNMDKFGNQHPPTRFVAGRLASKNLREFSRGRWTARLRLNAQGEKGMFPAWWLLGARNNEPPVQEPDENVCWPLPGSGEIDIFEHFGGGGPNHFAARKIKHQGDCSGGDWESQMTVVERDLTAYHEYGVEWLDDDLVFRVNGTEVFRLAGEASEIEEPLFAILNYAKIEEGPMSGPWVMEVDWVRYEVRADGAR